MRIGSYAFLMLLCIICLRLGLIIVLQSAVINLENQGPIKKRPFKFLDMWTSHEKFMNIIKKGWKDDITGTKMFKVVNKMKRLKKGLKQLNKEAFAEVDVKYTNLKNSYWRSRRGFTKILGICDLEVTKKQSYRIWALQGSNISPL